MDVPGDRSTSTSAPPVHPSLREAVRSPRRRRPTGAPPPLPYRLQTSGVGWLVAAVVLVGLTLAVFGRGMRGPAITATVVSDAVVRWLGGLHAPGLEALWQGLGHVGSWWTLMVLQPALLLALLVLRRWRHLIVWLVAWILAGNIAAGLAMTARQPRPFGVDLRTSWGGWAMPSLQVTYLAVLLVGILYTLVPEGRWRNTGKWVAAGLVALVGLARVALGVDAPNDVLVGAGIGVAIPLLLFRRFTPGEVFPVAYRRGRSAHLDIGGHGGRRSGGRCPSSSAWSSRTSSRSACQVRPAPPRCGSPSPATRPGSCSASCTPKATCAPTAGTSSAASCCTAGWRTRSRSTPSGGWCSRRTTPCR
jgi:membrane-associated phospholipid phosphatase